MCAFFMGSMRHIATIRVVEIGDECAHFKVYRFSERSATLARNGRVDDVHVKKGTGYKGVA